MSTASTSTHPIVLGPTLVGRKGSSSRQSFVSVKYNFRPPSIASDSVGLLHCKKRNEADWQLEYAIEHGTDERIANDAQIFAGPQSSARDVECVLVWDKTRNAYVLDHVTSNFSLKYDRRPGKLSADAQRLLPNVKTTSVPRSSSRTSALGLEIEEGELQPEAGIETQDNDVVMEETYRQEADDDDDDFAMQLQRDLEAFEDHSPEQEDEARESTELNRSQTGTSKENTKTGLGLMTSNGLQDEVITPRGSPYIDRPTKTLGQAAATARITHSTANGAQARSTPPGMSPASVANSPRPTGLESSLSASWRPPAQRSAVTLAFGDDDEDDEEDSDEDDDEEEEEEDDEDDEESHNAAATAAAEDVDDDLEAFARELEGSLMEPATPVEEKQPAKSGASRARRSSARGKK